MKKKLCFVIPTMHRGGAERVMSILTNAAVRRGYEVYLLLLSESSVDYKLDADINIIKLADFLQGSSGLKGVLKRYAILKNELCSLKPDLAVSFTTMCNIYTLLALRSKKIPVIISERNDPIKDCPSKIKRLIRSVVYLFARGCIFQTEDAKKHFGQKIQKDSVVIANPVKENLPYADVENAREKVVAAARLTEQKNYPMLLRAFKMFLQDYPQYTLHIYGNGEKKDELIALCNELDIGEQVVFEGNVEDLHERIKDAKMFVLSSDYEGISNSLLEAMAMGLPVVSTDCPCGGSRMLIKDGISGLLTQVGDETAFCNAMKKIAGSQDLANLLGKEAIKIREAYSEELIVKKYFDYFETIAAK